MPLKDTKTQLSATLTNFFANLKRNHAFSQEEELEFTKFMIKELSPKLDELDNFLKNFQVESFSKKKKNTIENKKRFHCDICNKYLATKTTFKCHRNIHLHLTPFKCSYIVL